MKKNDSVGNRRRFLVGASAAGAAAVAVVATSKSAPQPARGVEAKTIAGSGYQLSEHVRNYYRTIAV